MKEMYSHEMPLWMKLLGIWRINTDSIEFKWGYFSPRFGLALEFSYRYEKGNPCIGIQLLWGYFSIDIPFAKARNPDFESPRYGLKTFGNSLHLHWGDKIKIWDFPLVTLVFEKHEIQTSDGSWVEFVGSWEKDKAPDGRHKETHQYNYTLKSGEIQTVDATIYKERRRYHYKWLPFLKKTFTSMNVDFSSEVGEGTGSWKGGTVGCGYDIEPGESLLQCLRRMESEREFSR